MNQKQSIISIFQLKFLQILYLKPINQLILLESVREYSS